MPTETPGWSTSNNERPVPPRRSFPRVCLRTKRTELQEHRLFCYGLPSGVDWFWNWLGFWNISPLTCSTINWAIGIFGLSTKVVGLRLIISSVRAPFQPGWTVGAVKCTSNPHRARLLLPSIRAAKYGRPLSVGNTIFSNVLARMNCPVFKRKGWSSDRVHFLQCLEMKSCRAPGSVRSWSNGPGSGIEIS